MKSATTTNPTRDAAEPARRDLHPHVAGGPEARRSPSEGGPRPQNEAAIRSGRNSAPLVGRIRGTGVPLVPVSAAYAESATLCNITEQKWILHRTHGTFVVAGANPVEQAFLPAQVSVDAAQSAGAVSTPPVSTSVGPSRETNRTGTNACATAAAASIPFALTRVSGRTGAIDLGDKRTLEFPINARDIADDLAREINADGGEGSYFGVFVCAGDAPTEDELRFARERLFAFYEVLVAAADKQWERTHNVLFISDLDRRAARALGLEKDWSYEPHARIECPACGEKLKPSVAVCRTCGAVLNRAKAAQFGLAPEPTPSAQS
jgi:hypothetical protein